LNGAKVSGAVFMCGAGVKEMAGCTDGQFPLMTWCDCGRFWKERKERQDGD
jgi:hypothetical protein